METGPERSIGLYMKKTIILTANSSRSSFAFSLVGGITIEKD